MKSEPEVFSIRDLARRGKSLWDGVRNYQARNFMMRDMNEGDRVIVYHSSCQPPGVAGLARVSGRAVPDPTQFDKKSLYFDPRASRAKPIWYCVEIAFEREFQHVLPLERIRQDAALADLPLLRRGQRLSIQPLTAEQYGRLVHLAEERR